MIYCCNSKNSISGEISLKPVVINDSYSVKSLNIGFQVNSYSREISDYGRFRYSKPLFPGQITEQLLMGGDVGLITVDDLDEYISFLYL